MGRILGGLLLGLCTTVLPARAQASEQMDALASSLRKAGVDGERATRYARHFIHYGRETSTDPRLLAAIAYQESEFKARATNRASVGLMQVIPDPAWGKYASRCGAPPTRENLLDPRVNICYGAHIFAWWRENRKGDLRMALRGYNSGFRFLKNGYDRQVLSRLNSL